MMIWKRNQTAHPTRASRLQGEIDDLTCKIAELESRLGRVPTPAPAAAPIEPPTPLTPAVLAAPAPFPAAVDFAPPRRAKPEFNTAAHYNRMGVRKFDLHRLWLSLRESLGPSGPPNPKFTTYLAVNAVAGLPALKREKRVARNRVVVLGILLLLILWAVLSSILPQL